LQTSGPHIVALTGFMGAGKTRVGQALAALLKWPFFDLDHEIELQEEMPVREIFRFHGEPRFREIETETLRRLLEQVPSRTVIALGGGTFVQPSNARLLRNTGARVVFLETPVELMLQRCRVAEPSSADNLRPLAADPDAFRALYDQRLAHYRTADLTVLIAGGTAEENARRVATGLRLLTDAS
jgi:shikimate kinase